MNNSRNNPKRLRRLFGATTTLLIAALLACGLLACSSDSSEGPRVIVLGFDGLDYELTQQLMDAGRLPNFSRLAERGSYDPLETSIPPQSPVAWSNFITGMDAGGHGIFDFLSRDPEQIFPLNSMASTDAVANELEVGKFKFPLPWGGGGTVQMRQGIPFWQKLEEHGVETTVIRMPVNFPPSGEATRELSGMGTPDITGTDGTFSYYTSELFAFAGQEVSGRVFELDVYDNVVKSHLVGPPNGFLVGEPDTETEFTVYLDPERQMAKIDVQGRITVLEVGEWSDWINVDFEFLPMPGGETLGLPPLQGASGICRMYLRSIEPEFELYVTPIDMDPMNPPMPISTPSDYAAELAEATGLFYTEGMPEDTKTRTDNVFEHDEFLAQAKIAGDENVVQYDYVLENFLATPGGFLFYYFGNSDQIGHVSYRSMDPEHPSFEEDDATYADLIPSLYEEMDEIVGKTLDATTEDDLIIVMSDHGFTSWRRTFHLNAWLVQEGYLTPKNPGGPDPGYYLGVDWGQTKAYGLGFSGLYLNVQGREKEGIVTEGEKDALLAELRDRLLAVVDPETGDPAITEIHLTSDYEYQGAAHLGPDMVIGYAKRTRGSTESGTGEIQAEVFSDNVGAWSGDHMMDHRAVPGVLFVSRPLKAPAGKLRELPVAILAEYGIDGFPAAEAAGP